MSETRKMLWRGITELRKMKWWNLPLSGFELETQWSEAQYPTAGLRRPPCQIAEPWRLFWACSKQTPWLGDHWQPWRPQLDVWSFYHVNTTHMGTLACSGPIFRRRRSAARTPPWYDGGLTKRAMIEECVVEIVDDGVISPSQSLWASPVTLVTRKDGKPRFCMDYLALNAITKRDRKPLSHIQDIFDTVGIGRIFKTLDLK